MMLNLVAEECGGVGRQVDLVDRTVLDHLHAVAPELAGQFDLQGDGPGSGDQTGVRLEDDVVILRDHEGRVGPVQVLAAHPAVRDADRFQVGRHAGDVIDTGRAQTHAASPDVEWQARVGLQLAPGPEGRRHEASVARIGIGMAGDPGIAVRTTEGVAESELLDQQDRLTSPGQLVGRRRTHRSGTEDRVLGSNRVHGLGELSVF